MRLCLVLLLCAACRHEAAGAVQGPALPLPAGRVVAAGDDLQAAIDGAEAGSTLVLAAGEHQGPVSIRKALTLAGPRSAHVSCGDDGVVVDVTADDCVLMGFTVSGGGRQLYKQDGGVRVQGNRVRVEGLLVQDALFGIQVQLSKHARIAGTVVIGTGDEALGMRGDGIRLWETSDSEVTGNSVHDSRDVVVWYSSGNRIHGNEVRQCRYGMHFMYSHHNEVSGNRFLDDTVGVFVMYSHDLQLRDNLMARAGGSAGMGLGVKESGNLEVTGNWLLACTTGVYLDTSPLHLEHSNRFATNVVALCATGLQFHASAARNEFTDNDFRGNDTLATVGGNGSATDCKFARNHYDDYQGFDLDRDGIGDLPFEYRRMSAQLASRCPELLLLRGSPAMQMVDVVADVMPLFAARTLLRDPEPRMRAPVPRWTPEVPDAR